MIHTSNTNCVPLFLHPSLLPHFSWCSELTSRRVEERGFFFFFDIRHLLTYSHTLLQTAATINTSQCSQFLMRMRLQVSSLKTLKNTPLYTSVLWTSAHFVKAPYGVQALTMTVLDHYVGWYTQHSSNALKLHFWHFYTLSLFTAFICLEWTPQKKCHWKKSSIHGKP